MKKRITAIWQRLNFREKIILMTFMLVVMPMIIIRFIVIPAITESRDAYLDYQANKKNLLKFDSDLKFYREISLKSRSAEFNFQETLDNVLEKSDISSPPDINQEESEIFGTQYVLNFDGLRTDQILRLIFYLESNNPPVLIDKVETGKSIVDKDLNNLTLVIRTE